jgi:hypothetical protein
VSEASDRREPGTTEQRREHVTIQLNANAVTWFLAEHIAVCSKIAADRGSRGRNGSTAGATVLMLATSPFQPHPWIDHAIENVDHQIEHIHHRHGRTGPKTGAKSEEIRASTA